MKNLSLAAGAAIIVVANTFALIHVARDRMGSADSEITLTNRELNYFAHPHSDDDSGISVSLRWTESRVPMLNQQKLKSLGFDCSVSADNADAQRFYQRQQPRQAFIALEFEGPAWQRWLEEYKNELASRPGNGVISVYSSNPAEMSHLVPVDADLDAKALRMRCKDHSKVIILPVIIGIRLNFYRANEPTMVEGYLRDINPSVHIPRPFSNKFPREKAAAPYTVRLRYGSSYEPWVTAVAFPKFPN